MSKKELFLAADSGGSKTVWVLLNGEGDIIFKCRTQGVGAIKEGVLPVLETVKEAHGKIDEFGMPQSIYFSLGGPNIGEVESALKSCWQDVPICVEREACGNAILRAAKFFKCSAVVMCGTGSVAIGDTSNGRKFAGGWGPIYGDGGSGGGMGSDALKMFLNSVDSKKDIGGLAQIFSSLISGLDVTQFADRMELKNRAINMSRRELAALVPEIYRIAEEGDKTALSLFEHSAKEIAELALNVSDSAGGFEVLLCGGFFAEKPILLQMCEKEFSKISCAVLKYVPEFSPIVGAQIAVLENNNIKVTDEVFMRILNNQKEI